jgi:hypothetical protein
MTNKFIVGPILGLLLSYLSISFILMELDPTSWSSGERFVMMYIAAAICAVYAILKK